MADTDGPDAPDREHEPFPEAPRYQVRSDQVGEQVVWSVVDTLTHSLPAFVAGRAIAHRVADPAVAEADAAWLNQTRG